MTIKFKSLLQGIVFTMIFLLPAATAFAERPEITCEKQNFDFLTGRYLLDGNVCVRTNDRVITAEHAQVSLITQEVWAQGNVTLVQDDILFRGEDLHVEGKDHIATLSEKIVFERGDLTIKADLVVFNWDTKIAECSGKVIRILSGDEKKLSRLIYDVKSGEIISEKP